MLKLLYELNVHNFVQNAWIFPVCKSGLWRPDFDAFNCWKFYNSGPPSLKILCHSLKQFHYFNYLLFNIENKSCDTHSGSAVNWSFWEVEIMNSIVAAVLLCEYISNGLAINSHNMRKSLNKDAVLFT